MARISWSIMKLVSRASRRPLSAARGSASNRRRISARPAARCSRRIAPTAGVSAWGSRDPATASVSAWVSARRSRISRCFSISGRVWMFMGGEYQDSGVRNWLPPPQGTPCYPLRRGAPLVPRRPHLLQRTVDYVQAAGGAAHADDVALEPPERRVEIALDGDAAGRRAADVGGEFGGVVAALVSDAVPVLDLDAAEEVAGVLLQVLIAHVQAGRGQPDADQGQEHRALVGGYVDDVRLAIAAGAVLVRFRLVAQAVDEIAVAGEY